jgi:hypothetical protein
LALRAGTKVEAEKPLKSRRKKLKFRQMKTVTLLASAPTLERITKLVNQYFYSTSIELHEDSSGVYSLINSKGKIDGCRVIKKKNRFRFEMI